ncbi:MAG: hypothetical protein IJJ84_08310, partial [Kiritimatiellae bacterium]|nr:hypothetical protein [Kiritimatiellia bacterium]
MRLRCGTFLVTLGRVALVAAILTATASEVKPISVRVRQTAGGPRLFVDGKPIPPRAFYGAGPSIGFIAELREYTFTLPFVAPFDTARAEVRIGFPTDPSQYWIHDVKLKDTETGTVVPVDLSLVGAMKDGAPHPPHGISAPCPVPLVKGRTYRLLIPVRADHPRSFFYPSVVAFGTASKTRRCPLPYREDIWDYKAVAGSGGLPMAKEQTPDILRRNVSFEILRGLGDWWMDLFGRGWYNDPDLWKLRTELAPLEEAMFRRTKPYSPEIADIVDERSFLYLAYGATRAMAPLGLSKGLFHKEWGSGLRKGAAPLFAPILAEGDEVWATYRDLPENPALVARKHADGP